MSYARYTFQVSPADINALLPQVSQALEKRTELVSRARYPGLWKQTDKHNAAGRTSRSKLTARIPSLACLILGVILFVPSVMNPHESLSLLLPGTAGIATGIVSLWHSGKRSKNPFDRSAKQLLEGKDVIPDGVSFLVSFAGKKATLTVISDSEKEELLPYSSFECIIEAKDVFLLTYQNQVLLLQKKDLTEGSIDEFRKFISSRISLHQASE